MTDAPTLNLQFDLETARRIVGELADLIRVDCEQIAVGGSIRRGEPFVKDAELIALPKPNLLKRVDDLLSQGIVTKALYGEKQTTRWGEKYRGMGFQGIKVELFLADADNYGYQLWLRSGPASANAFVMKWLSWTSAPVRAHDGYWWHGERKLSIPDEAALFEVLGMPPIPPGERSETRYKKLTQWNRAHHWPDFSRFYIKAPVQLAMFGDALLDREIRGSKAGAASAKKPSKYISFLSVNAGNADQWAKQVRGESVAVAKRELAYFQSMAGIYPSYAARAKVVEGQLARITQ